MYLIRPNLTKSLSDTPSGNRVAQSVCFPFSDVDKFAEEQEVGIPTIQLIMDALSQSIGQDIRDGN